VIQAITSSDIINDANGLAHKPSFEIENIFFPSWDNRPPEQPSILQLNGTPILTHQNITAIIAAQGMGKTSVVEAIITGHLNPFADCLGFTGSDSFTGLICCDFERTNIDVWNSFYRIAKRAQLSYGQDLSKVTLAGMRSVPRVSERKDAIIHLLETKPCSILILDGAGDIVTDVNNLDQAIECRIWMRELTVKYGVSIFTTLHPNPGSIKPRGHQGSELTRECECVMIIQNQDGLRTITTDFEHGKNRNNGHATSAYQWNEEAGMFLSTDVPYGSLTFNGPVSKRKLAEPKELPEEFHVPILLNVFKKNERLKSGDFITNLMQYWDSGLGGEMKKSRAETFRQWYFNNDYTIVKSRQEGNATYNLPGDKLLAIMQAKTVD